MFTGIHRCAVEGIDIIVPARKCYILRDFDASWAATTAALKIIFIYIILSHDKEGKTLFQYGAMVLSRMQNKNKEWSE